MLVMQVFAEAKQLFKHDVFQLVFIHTTASLEYVLQGAKNWGEGGLINQDWEEDEKEQIQGADFNG
jgi:hypothetical protein